MTKTTTNEALIPVNTLLQSVPLMNADGAIKYIHKQISPKELLANLGELGKIIEKLPARMFLGGDSSSVVDLIPKITDRNHIIVKVLLTDGREFNIHLTKKDDRLFLIGEGGMIFESTDILPLMNEDDIIYAGIGDLAKPKDFNFLLAEFINEYDQENAEFDVYFIEDPKKFITDSKCTLKTSVVNVDMHLEVTKYLALPIDIGGSQNDKKMSNKGFIFIDLPTSIQQNKLFFVNNIETLELMSGYQILGNDFTLRVYARPKIGERNAVGYYFYDCGSNAMQIAY